MYAQLRKYSKVLYFLSQQHCGTEVVRWEEGKKWQKKVETLRTRLTEKQRELEGALKSLQALKDTLTRYSCGVYSDTVWCVGSRGRVVKAID